MTRGISVIGTDTGIGKTVVTAAIVLALRRAGVDAVPWKPSASGGVVRRGRLVSPDAVWWKRVLGLPDDVHALNAFCWRLPLAPGVAARLERGRAPVAWRPPREGRSPVVLEGVGGALVPVSGRVLFADLPAVRRLPTVVVGRAGLGTINHTLLTLEALRRRRIRVAGVILNGARGRDLSERTNAAEIARQGRVRVLAVLPRLRGVGAGGPALRALARRLPARTLRGMLRG